jgi:WD40 repeat protein
VTTLRRLFILLLALTVSVIAVQSAGASNSPNMRIEYSLNDTTSGRTHSDLAFWGNIAVAGDYDGFRVFNTDTHQELTHFLCRGPQNDVSLYKNGEQLLLFLSNDTPQTGGDTICSQNRTSDTSACGEACFEGIRIFDLTDPANPVFIKSVYTECGSHTHTLVPDLTNNRVLLYISSYPSGTGPLCQQATFAQISIVAVPLDDPTQASVISRPHIDAPPYAWGTGCHDITVFLPIHRAAASCQTQGQIWDITDPANPDTTHPLRRFNDSTVNFWHSAEFTWDGQYVTFDDEGNGTCTQSGDGKIRTYRVSDGQLMSIYMIPRSQGGLYCSVHNGMYIPVTGRYLLVAAWYYGGTSVVDLTNPSSPHEVAYYDPESNPTSGEAWSSYWYNGLIYTNDIRRGQDVFDYLTPTDPFGMTFGHLNAQTQETLLPMLSSKPALSRLLSARRSP